MVFLAVEARLARLLLTLRRDTRGGDAAAAPRNLSQSDLARLIGASRQTVNQLLGRWVAEGMVTRIDGNLIVRDPARLADLAESPI